MKLYKAFVICLLVSSTVFAQSATVTHVKGEVFYKGQALKIRDKVVVTDSLLSKDRNAEVGLLSPKTGRRFVRFNNGTPVLAKGAKRESELFSLTIKEFMEEYTASKKLSHKGGFDFIDFFSDTTGVGSPVPIMVVPGESIPLVSARLKVLPTDFMYLCSPGKDTTCLTLPMKAGWVTFPKEGRYAKMLVKYRYLFKGRYKERYFPYPVAVNVVPEKELTAIICAFKQHLADHYAGDEARMKEDLFSEITYLFGHYYSGTVERFASQACP